MKTKTLLVSCALAISILFSGCFGSFKLTNSIYDWNMGLSSDPVKEVVFLGFVIIPVYGFCLFLDGLILNTVEFWTGGNPMSMKDGEQDTRVLTYEGKEIRVTARRHEFEIIDENEEVTLLTYNKKLDSWFITKNGQTTNYPKDGLSDLFAKK